MKPNYRQCQLTKDNKKRAAWIPTKFAKVGMILRIKDDGEWSDGWKVEYAWEHEQPEEYLVEREMDYRHQREVSDI